VYVLAGTADHGVSRRSGHWFLLSVSQAPDIAQRCAACQICDGFGSPIPLTNADPPGDKPPDQPPDQPSRAPACRIACAFRPTHLSSP